MTVYCYRRVSSLEQDQDERTSLADQERRCRGIAMMRGVLADVVIVSDIDVSGALKFSKRPGGRRILGEIEAGDLVIASKMDRMFRSCADALMTVEDLRALGVGVILADIGTEPIADSATANLFFTMLAAFAEFDRFLIRERTADGRRGKKARGGHIGGLAPYGYRVNGSGREAMLIADLAEQSVIAEARRLASTGLSLRAVARELAASGRMSRTGKSFTATQVMRMLRCSSDEAVA